VRDEAQLNSNLMLPSLPRARVGHAALGNDLAKAPDVKEQFNGDLRR
jgi:hypothetical protein